MRSLVLSFVAPFVCINLSLLHQNESFVHAEDMYCGMRDCYDILDLMQSATTKDIRRAYRKLSLEYHPDKNPDVASVEIFRQIATAYEILSNAEQRAAYDYYIEHPEEHMYNTSMYYRYTYAPKTDLRLVLLGVILILSAIQYLSREYLYQRAVDFVSQSDTLRRKAKQIHQERIAARGTKSRKARQSAKDMKKELESIKQELLEQVDIRGGHAKPVIQDLLLFRILASPWTAMQALRWHTMWYVRYSLLRQDYREEDRVYLTARRLDVSQEYFLSEEFPDDAPALVARELWIDAHYRTFVHDKTQALRAKFPTKFKQMLRRGLYKPHTMDIPEGYETDGSDDGFDY